jgi:membrane protease YdiL (CAAX protease family)
MIPARRHPNSLSYLAVSVVAVWLAATGLTHLFNPCLAVGVAAVGASCVIVAVRPRFFAGLFLPNVNNVAAGLSAGVAMVAATYVLFPVVTMHMPGLLTATAGLYRLMGIPHAGPLVLLVLSMIIAGEEILWRGIVQSAVAERVNSGSAVLLSATVYGLSHAPIGSPLLVAVAVICGLVWSLLRWKYDSLIPSLIAHLMWDFAILLHPVANV